jgi:hypothetical protein
MTPFDPTAFHLCRGRCIRQSLVRADRSRGMASIAKHAVGEYQTACRPLADKRQIHRVEGPLSRSKSGGRVLQ